MAVSSRLAFNAVLIGESEVLNLSRWPISFQKGESYGKCSEGAIR